MSSSEHPFSEHVAAIARAVWGAEASVGRWNGAPPAAHRYVAAPSAATAHQLLPWSPSAIAAAAGRRSLDRPWPRRLRDAAGTAALLGRAAVRDHERIGIVAGPVSLVDVLRDELRLPIHTLVVLCGPPRANQKPVVQAIDRAGRTLAFAKLAWNDLTTELLSGERAALDELGRRDLGPVAVPRVIGTGTLDGVDWLALSPVAARASRRPLTHLDAAAAIERATGTHDLRLGATDFARSLLRRAAGHALAAPAAARLLEEHGDTTVTVGAWHGDFVPWNMSAGRDRVAVWDWERFASGVPVGFDRLHFQLQRAVHRRGRTIAAALAELRGSLDVLLFHVEPGGRAATHDAYLAELLVRYEHDSIESPSPNLTSWCHELARNVARYEVAR